MGLVSPNVALVVFAAILVMAAFLALKYYNYDRFDKSAFHSFVVILTGLGVFVTFMFYYNVVQLQNQEQELTALQELTQINNSMENDLLAALREASSVVPAFVLSLTPLAKQLCCEGGTCLDSVPADPVTPQACVTKTTLSHRIFSIWQNIVQVGEQIDYDDSAYLVTFLQWANSQPLSVQWSIARIGFGDRVKLLGDLLFEYALPITNQTPELYVQTAQELRSDPRYLQSFSS